MSQQDQFRADARALQAPMVAKHKQTRQIHGVVLEDDYGWLRAANWHEVLRDPAALPAEIRTVIEAENAYADSVLSNTAALQELLIKEMRGRIKEDDTDVPYADGPFLYYNRHRPGGQHPIICRRLLSGGDEEILLDGDAQAKGKAFFDLAEARPSPDHRKLAWSFDDKGSELYSVKLRDLAGTQAIGTDRLETIIETDGSLVWSSGSDAFYYVRVDANHRTAQVFRHRLGTDPNADELVVEELDPAWFVHLHESSSRTHAIVTIEDHVASECYLIDLADPAAKPRLVAARAPDLRYTVEPQGGILFIRTNADGAEDFKIVRAPTTDPGRSQWVDEVPHKRGRLIVAMKLFKDYLVWLEREAGLPRIVCRNLASGEDHVVSFAEEAFHLRFEENLGYASNVLRFVYSSMTTPQETYDYDLATHARTLRKRQEISSGHDPALYVTRRLFATAPDGETVPISILHRKDLPRDGTAPLLLYGYGAYGAAMPASFDANRLSLVDRGFVYAIAHIRGGTDKGWYWYIDGKLAKKPNTFSDFIVAARYLIAENYTRTGRIVARGGSAGGMLMGAVANLAPEFFAGIIADVPFVDVLNTMLDADLPLTPPEWLEWGNPIADPEAFAAIRAYSPYDNVAAKAYPPILALGGLTDPRVTYWEPAKWVARLRATMTGGGPILLKTNMGAGHGGPAGRFEQLVEIALQYAFALTCVAEG
ncbi:S9 family peptidase [Methylovirgula sp. HY1]|uniref:S9 family peptidase n=1 Tax=Methylovirgula sp. HY1 TaxID=2822761 RepID=UPI001C5B254A